MELKTNYLFSPHHTAPMTSDNQDNVQCELTMLSLSIVARICSEPGVTVKSDLQGKSKGSDNILLEKNKLEKLCW